MTVVVALVGALLVFVLIVAVQAYFYNAEEAERETKVYAQVPQDLALLRAQQQEQLHSYRWIDQGKGVVAIPIERAMDLTVQDQGKIPGFPVAPAAASQPNSSGPAGPGASREVGRP